MPRSFPTWLDPSTGRPLGLPVFPHLGEMMKTSELIEIRRINRSGFETQLKQFGVKGKKLQDLFAGFEDGMTAMFASLRELGLVTIELDESK